MKGDTIAGRYRVEKLIGVGSSGFVVAARHARLGQRVALKILTSLAAEQGKAVLAVAQRVASLRNPHVAHVVDTGFTEEGYPFVATELSEGRTVADLLAERSALSAREAIGIVLQVCAGLAEAHAAGIVHGDLKPQNLLLTKTGTIELLDFGMTQPLESEEASAAWFASPAYLAPEQLRDPSVDSRADIWALGVILHQLVAGRLPFEAETIAGMFVAVAYDEPALLAAPDVPYELAKIVHDCLAKNASARPQTVDALARRLAPFSGVDAQTATSIAPQLAMAVSVGPDEHEHEREHEVAPLSEEAIDSRDMVDASTELDEVARIAALFTRASSRPPPLPGHRLGAAPRAPRLPDLRKKLASAPDVAKSWIVARLAAVPLTGPDTRTKDEQSFQHRRWGAVGVVAAAAVLGVASLFATPPSSSAAASEVESDRDPAGTNLVEPPLSFGLLPFIPPSFALTDRENAAAPPPPPPPFAAAVLPSPPPSAPIAAFRAPIRTRLSVRDDPYSPYGRSAAPARSGNAHGFTHPAKLPPPPSGTRSRGF